MSDTNKDPPGVYNTVPVTASPAETPSSKDTAPTFGIEVSPTKVYDEKTKKQHDATGIKISPALFLRDFKSTMKKSIRSMRGQAKVASDRDGQPGQPPEDEHKSAKRTDEAATSTEEETDGVNWKEVHDELNQGLKEVDKILKEVNWKEVHDGLDKDLKEAEKTFQEVKVDLKEMQNEFKKGLKEVDKILKEVNWKEVHDGLDKDLKEAEKTFQEVKVDLKEMQNEFKKGMEEVDWTQVHKSIQEGAWNEVHRQFSEATKGVDWKGVFNDADEGQEGKKNDVQDAIPETSDLGKDTTGKVADETG
eukprot:230789_1